MTIEWLIVGFLILSAIAGLIILLLPSRRDPCRGCSAAALCRKKEDRKSTCGKNR